MDVSTAAEALDDLLTSWQMAVNAGPLTAAESKAELLSWGLSAKEADEYIAEFDPVDQMASYERKQAQLEAVTWLLNRARALDDLLLTLQRPGPKSLHDFSTEHTFD